MSADDLHPEPSPVEGRLIDAHCSLLANPEPQAVAYNHSLFCQTSLPYRNPGDDVREVTRTNGAITVEYTAGKVPNQRKRLVPIGLPYGPRARLVLIHLITQAVLHQSPRVDLGDQGVSSLTAFARELGLASSGQNIKTLRDQMRRLAACSVRITSVNRRRASKADAEMAQFQAYLIEGMELFAPRDPNQKALWPSHVQLNHTFFKSILEHAVPLDPRALHALKHSAAALDVYQWLAQRLHREKRGTLIPWRSLHLQLGGGSKDVSAWKANFLGGRKRGRAGVLPQVLAVYPAAQEAVVVLEDGVRLRQAEPPVPKWGLIQQRRAALGGGQIKKRTPSGRYEVDPVQADETNPACPRCGHRATLATWEARGDCAMCGAGWNGPS